MVVDFFLGGGEGGRSSVMVAPFNVEQNRLVMRHSERHFCTEKSAFWPLIVFSLTLVGQRVESTI